jgi:hypothetical protein
MPAPVGDCSTPPRGYIFREWQERALRGVSRERRGLAARLLVSHCFHSGVSYGHFAISMHQAGGPHPLSGSGAPLTYQAKPGSSQRQSAAQLSDLDVALIDPKS